MESYDKNKKCLQSTGNPKKIMFCENRGLHDGNPGDMLALQYDTFTTVMMELNYEDGDSPKSPYFILSGLTEKIKSPHPHFEFCGAVLSRISVGLITC